ncbi:EamA family transporter RarD [Sphingobium sp.]|uniref:EamA family transporter RarD n=1 Tax=Sphingobium sp. TaxID=1912891 RepID=UPI00391B383F
MLAAVTAYGAWGLLPIFFRLLHHVNSVEIVTQRILWSLLLIITLLLARKGLPALFEIVRDRRLLLPLAGSALMIAVNWLTYVWAVNAGHVIAASLGYFLNPLVNVGLGVLLLHERLRRGQALAIGIAALGVAIMAATALTTLWISVTLALSFAFYGLIRKMTPVAPMMGLGVETVLLALPAMAYLIWLSTHGGISFGQDVPTTALLIISGAVTTVPLVLFASAAQSLPMATLGLLQYLAPTLQFLCGMLLFGEKLNQGQMVSFALIWGGLVLFAADSLAAARRNRLAIVQANCVASKRTGSPTA